MTSAVRVTTTSPMIPSPVVIASARISGPRSALALTMTMEQSRASRDEMPVLEGAARTLAQANLLIIEAYNFTLLPGCLRFHELCAWLEPRGFRCCDLGFDLFDTLKQSRLCLLAFAFALTGIGRQVFPVGTGFFQFSAPDLVEPVTQGNDGRGHLQ